MRSAGTVRTSPAGADGLRRRQRRLLQNSPFVQKPLGSDWLGQAAGVFKIPPGLDDSNDVPPECTASHRVPA